MTPTTDPFFSLSWICSVQETIRAEDPPEPPPVETPPEVPPAEVSPPAPSEPEVPSPTPPPAPSRDWRDDRIAQLTAEKHDLKARLAEAAKPGESPPAQPLPEDEISRRAAVLVAQQRFDSDCDAIAQAGRKEIPTFDSDLSQLSRVVDPRDAASSVRYTTMIQGIIDATDGLPDAKAVGAKLLSDLGQNLNEASRLMALPPTKMVAELVKRATGVAKLPEPSNAPPPIKPLTGRGGNSEIDPQNPDTSDRLTTAEWMRRREAQVAAQPRRY